MSQEHPYNGLNFVTNINAGMPRFHTAEAADDYVRGVSTTGCIWSHKIVTDYGERKVIPDPDYETAKFAVVFVHEPKMEVRRRDLQ